MAYVVNLTIRAQRDLSALYEYIHADQSATARSWYNGLRQAVLSLEELPCRCPVTPENKRTRQLLYGHKPNVYRIVFRVLDRKKQVVVLHIRHGARHR